MVFALRVIAFLRASGAFKTTQFIYFSYAGETARVDHRGRAQSAIVTTLVRPSFTHFPGSRPGHRLLLVSLVPGERPLLLLEGRVPSWILAGKPGAPIFI